jgi:hypothetical protein
MDKNMKPTEGETPEVKPEEKEEGAEESAE